MVTGQIIGIDVPIEEIQCTTWEISSTKDFTTLVASSVNDTKNLTSIVFEELDIDYGREYYGRARVLIKGRGWNVYNNVCVITKERKSNVIEENMLPTITPTPKVVLKYKEEVCDIDLVPTTDFTIELQVDEPIGIGKVNRYSYYILDQYGTVIWKRTKVETTSVKMDDMMLDDGKLYILKVCSYSTTNEVSELGSLTFITVDGTNSSIKIYLTNFFSKPLPIESDITMNLPYDLDTVSIDLSITLVDGKGGEATVVNASTTKDNPTIIIPANTLLENGSYKIVAYVTLTNGETTTVKRDFLFVRVIKGAVIVPPPPDPGPDPDPGPVDPPTPEFKTPDIIHNYRDNWRLMIMHAGGFAEHSRMIMASEDYMRFYSTSDTKFKTLDEFASQLTKLKFVEKFELVDGSDHLYLGYHKGIPGYNRTSNNLLNGGKGASDLIYIKVEENGVLKRIYVMMSSSNSSTVGGDNDIQRLFPSYRGLGSKDSVSTLFDLMLDIKTNYDDPSEIRSNTKSGSRYTISIYTMKEDGSIPSDEELAGEFTPPTVDVPVVQPGSETDNWPSGYPTPDEVHDTYYNYRELPSSAEVVVKRGSFTWYVYYHDYVTRYGYSGGWSDPATLGRFYSNIPDMAKICGIENSATLYYGLTSYGAYGVRSPDPVNHKEIYMLYRERNDSEGLKLKAYTTGSLMQVGRATGYIMCIAAYIDGKLIDTVAINLSEASVDFTTNHDSYMKSNFKSFGNMPKYGTSYPIRFYFVGPNSKLELKVTILNNDGSFYSDPSNPRPISASDIDDLIVVQDPNKKLAESKTIEDNKEPTKLKTRTKKSKK